MKNKTVSITATSAPKTKNILKYISALSIVAFTLIFFAINNSFLSLLNIDTLLMDTAPLLIMAAGATFVILLGSIDLSIGSVCSVANVLFVALMPGFGFWSYPLTALYGVLAGFLLGIVHVKIKIPSFIASLGFMSIWSSVALLINDAPLSIAQSLRYLIKWGATSFGVVNITIVLAAGLIVVFYLLQTRTVFGKGVYAIGGNERTARLAGIPVDKIKIIAFTLAGLCSAMGGLFLAIKLKSSAPTVGSSFTLLVIASVALGGTALDGGKGNILGTILGVALVTIIQNGMNIVGVDAFWQQIVFGIIVIGAVILTVDRSRRNLVVK